MKKFKCSCLLCKTEIAAYQLENHHDSKSCKLKSRKSANAQIRNIQCSYCGKICKNHNSWRNHERTCPKNKNRTYNNGMIGKTPWNKGKTKHTDKRVQRHSKIVSKRMKELFDSGYKTKTQTQEYWTKAKRKAKSEWKKQLHKDRPELHPNRLLANNRSKMTYPEKVAHDWLSKHLIEFEHQKKIGKFYVDFLVEDVIIEIDGEHWHPLGNKKDALRDQTLSNLGYTVYRIRSKEHIEVRLGEIFGV